MIVTADPPWLRRSDWAAGRVLYRHSSWPAVALSWFMGLWSPAMLVVTGPLILRNLRKYDTLSRDERIGLPLVVLVLLAFGMFFLRQAMRETRRKRYGLSVFEMAHVPGVPGGRLEGVVRAHSIPMSSTDVQVTLACGLTNHPGTDLDTSTDISSTGPTVQSYALSAGVLWKETQRVDRRLLVESATGIGIPVSFAIPANLPQTYGKRGGSYGWVAWRVQATIPSTDYDARFIVPVFKTA